MPLPFHATPRALTPRFSFDCHALTLPEGKQGVLAGCLVAAGLAGPRAVQERPPCLPGPRCLEPPRSPRLRRASTHKRRIDTSSRQTHRRAPGEPRRGRGAPPAGHSCMNEREESPSPRPPGGAWRLRGAAAAAGAIAHAWLGVAHPGYAHSACTARTAGASRAAGGATRLPLYGGAAGEIAARIQRAPGACDPLRAPRAQPRASADAPAHGAPFISHVPFN